MTAVPTFVFLRGDLSVADRVDGADAPKLSRAFEAFAKDGGAPKAAGGCCGGKAAAGGGCCKTQAPAADAHAGHAHAAGGGCCGGGAKKAAAPAAHEHAAGGGCCGGGAAKAEDPTAVLNKRIQSIIDSNRVMVFMKGSPAEPKCGFSKTLVALLAEQGVKEYGTFDILTDNDVRQGIKTYR